MTELEHFKKDVERYIAQNSITATEFGVRAVKDPNFVFSLRQGREPRIATRNRVSDFMQNEIA